MTGQFFTTKTIHELISQTMETAILLNTMVSSEPKNAFFCTNSEYFNFNMLIFSDLGGDVSDYDRVSVGSIRGSVSTKSLEQFARGEAPPEEEPVEDDLEVDKSFLVKNGLKRRKK